MDIDIFYYKSLINKIVGKITIFQPESVSTSSQGELT